MSYYKLLGLSAEPFSTSPDPAFLYLSRGHRAALTRIQIAISLKRGLSVVMGEVGTGKTTLSRKLAQVLRENEQVCFHMILNPCFKSQKQFLAHLAALFHLDINPRKASGMECIEAVEQFLYRRGVQERKTVALLVDEAQMVPDYVLEILRILLNYETNEYKILQLILVGQMELLPRISRMQNFWDRIALKCLINPLGLDETREMIQFRLRQAGYEGPGLFSEEAIRAIHEYTRGYPRKLGMFCHDALEHLVMQDRRMVDEAMVRELISRELLPVGGTAGGVPDVC